MLRTRLFLNLVPFAVMLLAVGGYAVVLLSRLANDVEASVTENYRKMVTFQALSTAASRLELGLRLAMEGERTTGAAVFEENARLFEEHLAVHMKDAGKSQARQLAGQLQTNYVSLRAAGQVILAQDQRTEQRRIWEETVAPRTRAIALLLQETRQLNHQEILATSQDIQLINQRVTRLMILGLVVALVISAYASFQLGRSILKPIQLVTRATREIGQGNLDQTVPVLSKDELGELAQAFNKMAAQLKAYRQSTTEEILRLHRTREATLASFPDPIFVLDQTGRIELRNPAAEDLSRKLALQDALPARLREPATAVLREGKDFLPHSFKEVLSFRVNGEEKFFLPRILAMRGEASAPVGVAVVLYDVTRFRLLDDAKTNLVATVSHELRTPLTSVRMVLHLLLEKVIGPLTPKQDELLQTARKDAERLLGILNDLLDLTRLEAGNSELNKERVAPAELVRGISDELRSTVVQQGLRFASVVLPDLPAVRVDRQRIALVFHNFVANAIKHSPPGGEIRLCASQTENGGIQFSVMDQGPGVPEEYQGRVFDRFFRVPGQTRSGAGLGLSIAREIVVAHGGRIGVRSQPGKGSEFYLILSSAEAE